MSLLSANAPNHKFAMTSPHHQSSWLNTLWLFVLSLSLLLGLLSFSSYVAALPFIREEWALTNGQAGLIFSSYLIGYALSALILVPITNRTAPQWISLIGLIISTGSHLLFPLLAQDMWVALILRFFAGAGHMGMYIPGIQVVSHRYANGKRGLAVGIFVSAGYAGTTLSYTATGYLLSQVSSWRTAYFVTALAGLVAIGLMVCIFPQKIRRRAEEADKLTLIDHLKSRTQTDTHKPSWIDQLKSLPKNLLLDVNILRDRSINLLIISYTLHTAELYLARLWFPLLLGAALINQGMTLETASAEAAWLSGLIFTVGIAGVSIGAAWSDYVGRSMGASLIFAVSGTCSFIVGWLVDSPSTYLLWLGFVYGFSTAADSAIYSTAAIELSPPDRIGSTQALQSFIGFTGGAIVPVVAGLTLDIAPKAQQWIFAFSFNGLLAILGVIALLWLRRLPQAERMAGGKR